MAFQLPSLANPDLGLFLLFLFLCAGNGWALMNFAGGCYTMKFMFGGDQKNPCAFWLLLKMGESSFLF